MEYAPASVEAQINNLIDTYLAGEQFEPDISKLGLRIYIQGDSWAGVVDKPLAKFLLDLDKKLSDELAKLGIELPNTPHGLVALKVDDGSLDAVLQYAKGILQAVTKMKLRDQLFIYLTAATALGFVMGPEIIEKIQAAPIREIEAREKVQLIEAVGKVIEATRDLQQPARGLVNSMKENDRITLPGQTGALTKKEAKDILVKSTRSKPKQYYIDGNYIVEELSTKKPGEWEIGLKWGDQTFRAKMLLSSKEVDDLMDSFQLAHLSGSNIAPDLQVTAMINAKGVYSASVVGLGDRRKGSNTLGEVYAEIEEAANRDGEEE
ncbi:hypothetical protein EI77_04329 [Prosthecobacter fusiformis]|uniref:Uncharacterized protein n=1 Tax=Prosthecobacter fusiformis TaxID=48464 RepID=A0A4R7RKI7_9BACT|nr:hypothetical protein [Prosthecobacter fusiformis]TDU64145.1 hypothetical protein EI77_04329 [Prosthecobacter fusiformis]